MPNLRELSPRTKKFILVQGSALVVFAFAALLAGNALSSNPQTCTICHEMNEPIKAWQSSSHEKIACTECHHAAPGLYGFVIGIPKKLTEGMKHVTGEYSLPIKAEHRTESKVCQKCHVSWRGVSPSGDLIVPHNLHFEKRNIPCVRCHSRVVHGEMRDEEFMRKPAMQVCLTCHETGREGAPKLKCKACHTEKAIPASHRVASWFEMHSKIAKDPKHPDSNCKKCHGWTPTFCSNCHQNNRPSTHVGGVEWRTTHSLRAAERKTGCLVCHDKQNFCYRCHDPFTD